MDQNEKWEKWIRYNQADLVLKSYDSPICIPFFSIMLFYSIYK